MEPTRMTLKSGLRYHRVKAETGLACSTAPWTLPSSSVFWTPLSSARFCSTADMLVASLDSGQGVVRVWERDGKQDLSRLQRAGSRPSLCLARAEESASFLGQTYHWRYQQRVKLCNTKQQFAISMAGGPCNLGNIVEPPGRVWLSGQCRDHVVIERAMGFEPLQRSMIHSALVFNCRGRRRLCAAPKC